MTADPIHFPKSCALCGANAKLEQSHIIPQFVYRWAKATAGGRPIPAGPTRPMLCGRCEDVFSTHESEFARHVFHPLAAGAPLAAKYGAWLRQFAASVGWRILEVQASDNGLGHFQGRWAAELAACRTTWRDYLRRKRPDVGAHHFHLLPRSALANGQGGGLRSLIESAIVCTDTEAFVYAGLGPVIVIGLIADPVAAPWQGTRLNAEGKLKPRDVVVPARFRACLDATVHRGATAG